MINLRLILLYIIISAALSCSKDATKIDSLTPDVKFNELGSDGPYYMVKHIMEEKII